MGPTTSQLTTLVKRSDSPDAATRWHTEHGEPTLKDELYRLMTAGNLSARDIIDRVGIERSYFYHILSGQRIPSRNVLLRIALCIGADLKDTRRMLRLSGEPDLYVRVRRDALLIYALQHHLSMEDTNAMLLEEHEIPLYREERHE